jgi:hypothetical protein
MKKVYAGIIHDTYTDENGKEVPYTSRIIAVKKGGRYNCVDLPDFMHFEMSNKDFKEKVTDVQEIFTN